MKKILKVLLLFATIPLLAQTETETGPGTWDFLAPYFQDVATLTAAAVLAIDFLKNLFPKILKPPFLNYFSYFLPVVLAVLAYQFGIGFTELDVWWKALLIGVISSVTSYFTAYVGLLEIILKLAGIDLGSYRKQAREE